MVSAALPRPPHAHPGARARTGVAVLYASALLLTACGREQAATNQGATAATPRAEAGAIVFGAGARDRLCLKGDQAAFITYAAAGDANCTLRGSANATSIRPDGDASCSVPLTRAGDRVTLGTASPGCAYYCGPDASFAGKTFTRMAQPQPITDLAGDPLC